MKLYFDVIDQNVILSYVTYNLNKKWFFFFKIRVFKLFKTILIINVGWLVRSWLISCSVNSTSSVHVKISLIKFYINFEVYSELVDPPLSDSLKLIL